MSLNETITADPRALPADELIVEYEKLSNAYKFVKTARESDLQQIFDQQKQIEILNKNLNFLEGETTEINSLHENAVINWKRELDTARTQLQTLRHEKIFLETQCDQLNRQVDDFREQIDRFSNCAVVSPQTENVSSRLSLENRDRDIAELESEKIKLTYEVAELREQLSASKVNEQVLTSQLEVLTEKVQCAEENYQSKKQDLAENELALDTAHQKIVELKLEIASLQQMPENAKKGNSLFAEVDDQRQKMRSILAIQNQQYKQMKKAFDEKDFEIRRLKLENDSIEKQMQECQFMFTSADQSYKRRLMDRINQLLRDNEELTKRKEWTEDKLAEVANGRGQDCVDVMVEYCRQETEELKRKLYSCMLEKSLLEDNILNNQHELVKWRLEALKSRSVIMKREALLSEAGINFGPVVYAKPTDDEIEGAKPRWFNMGSKMISCDADTTEPPKDLTKLEEEIVEDTKMYQQTILDKLATLKPAVNMPSVPEINEVIGVGSDSELDISEVWCLAKDQEVSGREVPMFDMSIDEIDKHVSPKKSPPMPPCSTPVYRDIVFTPKPMTAQKLIQPRKILLEKNQPSILVREKPAVSVEEKKVKFFEPDDTAANENRNSNNESMEQKSDLFKKPSKSVIVRKIFIASKSAFRAPEQK